jgi:hypothetical protein
VIACSLAGTTEHIRGPNQFLRQFPDGPKDTFSVDLDDRNRISLEESLAMI